jgi:iron complex outermembrane receptor protein
VDITCFLSPVAIKTSTRSAMRTFASVAIHTAVRAILFAASTAALFGSAASYAQEHSAASGEPVRVASAGDGNALENVTVTARRREENAQDVPIPIAAVTGAALESFGQFRLEELNQRLPSTNVFFQNPRQTSIAVRGLGNNLANDALESSVGVYLDNVYLGRPGMANLDLIDIEQVALLRGPQGTLFGKNTTAGVLNISTRRPTFEPEAIVESSVGNDSYWQVRGAFSGPLTQTFAARVSAAKTSRDGYIKAPLLGTELNETQREGVRAQLLWQPSENFDLRLIADYNREDSDCCAGVIKDLGPNNGAAYLARIAATGAIYQFDPDYATVYINSYQHMSVDQGGYSAETNWNLGFGKLTSITAYRYWEFEPFNDADGTSLSAILTAAQLVDDEQWSQEIRWASPSGETIEYVAGLYYFYQTQSNLQRTQYGPDAGLWLLRPQFNDGYSATEASLHTRSGSLFAQATWNVTDQLSFTGGLRGTTEQKNTSVHRLTPTGPNPAIVTLLPEYISGDLERTDDNVSALVSASYKFTPDVLTYVSVSRGSKSGGINPAVPPTVAGGLPINESLFIEPETATDYELGVKTSFWGNRVQLNSNLYWIDVKDYQAARSAIINGVSTQTLGNIGGVRSRGVEAEISAAPAAGLSIALAASYNDAEYVDYKNAPCPAERAPATICDLTGEGVHLAPKWIVNPSVSYERPIGGLTAFTNVNYAWRSEFYGSSDSSQLTWLDAYGVLNARVGVRGALGTDNEWSVALWANNALDEAYFQSLNRGASGEYAGYPGMARTYGATVRVDF